MSADFWDQAIVVVFFVYGLAFYSLGLALYTESGRASELHLARSMRLLAGFGLLHGSHEWLDMVEREFLLHHDNPVPEWLLWVRLVFLVTSFVALIAFGEHLLRSNGGTISWQITIGATVIYGIGCVLLPVLYELDDRAWAKGCDVLARYVLAIPGGVLGFWALWLQRSIFRRRGMDQYILGLTVASVALVVYGGIGQGFVAKSVFFPSTVINAELFQDVFGFPVQLFRAAMAITVTLSMIYVLRALEFENQQRLEAVEWSRLQAERHSHVELTRLNAELQAAHAETTRLLHEVQRRDAVRGELLHHITTAQENERRRIARELHDGTGQILTGLALGLRGTADLIVKDAPRAIKRLTELEQMTTTAIGELRHLISDLRPPQLDDMGLAAALRWLIQHIEQRDKFNIKLSVVGDAYPLSPEVETTLFRITQEGLNNVVKHAQATEARVKLSFGPPLQLCVEDNGIGFDLGAALGEGKSSSAWGLVGMQERANLINAELVLTSVTGEGTTLIVQLAASDITATQEKTVVAEEEQL